MEQDTTTATIRKALLSMDAHDRDLMTAEASGLGLTGFPRWVAVPDGGLLFALVSFSRDAEGEITSAHYRTGAGFRLTIFND